MEVKFPCFPSCMKKSPVKDSLTLGNNHDYNLERVLNYQMTLHVIAVFDIFIYICHQVIYNL